MRCLLDGQAHARLAKAQPEQAFVARIEHLDIHCFFWQTQVGQTSGDCLFNTGSNNFQIRGVSLIVASSI